MKMSGLEKPFIRSPLRTYLLRKDEAPKVLADLGLGRDSVCLEIGCGYGAGTLLINQYLNCRLVIGVDVDCDIIRAARRYILRRPGWARTIRNDNIELSCQDAARLSFPDRTFDGVFLFGVLDHIIEWPAVINEIFRVLKVGGVFSFEEFLLGESWENRLNHTAIREAELKKSLTEAGFSIQRFRMMRYLPRCFVRCLKNSSVPDNEGAGK